MSALRDRRPRLITSISSPDVFCRPMDPGPAPLVYINGWHGIGKETVAECLTLLLGRDKSLLIDVRGVGRDNVAAPSTCGAPGHVHQQKHRQRREHNSLLTPEHPRYFSFDPDFGPNLPSPSAASFWSASSRSASFSSDTSTATNTTAVSTSVSVASTHPAAVSSGPPFPTATIPEVLGCSVQPLPVRVAVPVPVPVPVVVPVPVAVSDPIPVAVHVPFSCPDTPVAPPVTAAAVAVLPTPSAPAAQAPVSTPAAPSTTHTNTIATTTTTLNTTISATTISSPTTTTSPTTLAPAPPSTDTTTTATPTTTPCSSENLTRLLTHPLNRRRIAVLAACSPDSPAGRAALATFQAAAASAGRAFVSVALICAPREHARRAGAGGIMGMGMPNVGLGLGGGGFGVGVGGGQGRGFGCGGSESGSGFDSGSGSGLGMGMGMGTITGSGSGSGAGADTGVGSTASLACGDDGSLGPATSRSRSRGGVLIHKRGLSGSFVAAGRVGSGSDDDATVTEDTTCADDDESDHPCTSSGGQLVGPRPRGRLMSVPAAVPVVPVLPVHVPGAVHPGSNMATAAGTEVEWAQGQGLAMPADAGLTVDITCVPAFEAALQIVEFVRGVEAERDAETCSSGGGSPAITPGDGGLDGKKWKALGLGGAM